MKITIGQLRALINEAGAPKKKASKKKTVKKPSPKKAGKGKPDLKKVPRPETPTMVMAKLVVALRGAGLKFRSKEKNQGARRTWLNFVQGPGLPPPERDSEHVHEEQMAKVIASLNSVGIKPTGYENTSDGTKIQIPGGYVIVTNEQGANSLGSDVVVSLFDGPRAHQEEMGMDTGDMGFEPL